MKKYLPRILLIIGCVSAIGFTGSIYYLDWKAEAPYRMIAARDAEAAREEKARDQALARLDRLQDWLSSKGAEFTSTKGSWVRWVDLINWSGTLDDLSAFKELELGLNELDPHGDAPIYLRLGHFMGDREFELITSLPNLAFVDLNGCSVSEDKIAAYQASHPDVEFGAYYEKFYER